MDIQTRFNASLQSDLDRTIKERYNSQQNHKQKSHPLASGGFTMYRILLSLVVIVFATVTATDAKEHSMEDFKSLKVGAVAPDFTLKGDDGKDHSLRDYLGKKNIVLAFYPKDFTGGWTAELRSLRDELSKIEATDSVILGVSVDDVDSHKRFQDAEKFGFRLLADTEFGVSKTYSGIMEKFNASNRVTFIIDKAGYIRAIDQKVNVQNHGADVVKLIESSLPKKLEAGQPAPDFIATDGDGKTYQLSRFKGKKNVVLAFYPKDFTGGWTAEVCSLRDESSAFVEHETQVFAISVQDADSHKRFSAENNLNFPLLVDTGRNLSLLFGATDDPKGFSKRITVIIDREGKITKIDKQVSARTHGKDLVDFFKSM
jgi:thioredoxin-dependent peroxiredoxin